MLIPTKFENLEKNPLILGADIISILKKSESDIETLYQNLYKKKEIGVDLFFDTLTFLWLADLISLNELIIRLKNVT